MLLWAARQVPETMLQLRRAVQKTAKGETTAVRRGHDLDVTKVLAFLNRSGEGVEVKQFAHGQSNPTFLLTFSDDDSKRLVLRKQPSGTLLRGAHDVEREYAVAKAMRPLGVPAPEAVALCVDTEVLGTKFWVYEYVDGLHFKDAYLEGANEQRQKFFLGAARCAATLHSATPPADLVARLRPPRKGDYACYLERQVKTWRRQYEAADAKLAGGGNTQSSSSSTAFELADRLAAEVAANRADVDEGEAFACVSHGDFRTDNMIFDKDTCEVASLLDFELSALGHPLADLANFCMPYAVPPMPVPGPLSGYEGLDLAKHGIPTSDSVVGAYVDAIDRLNRPGLRDVVDRALPHLSLFAAVGYFRLASIVRGVYARAKAGNASAANAAAVGSLASTLVHVSNELCRRPAKTFNVGQRRSFSSSSSNSRSDLVGRVRTFVDEEILPHEKELLAYEKESKDRWTPSPRITELKEKAKAEGLWNLFFLQSAAQEDRSGSGKYQLASDEYRGGGLSKIAEYAPVCEAMGRSLVAPEIFNCNAPDTGNMEVIAQFGTDAQKARWLRPLLDGEIRSCFGMTEPGVASSDPTNLEATIRDDGDGLLVLNGRKWWTSGAMDPRCEVCIFMGKATGATVPADAPPHRRHSMVLVPMSELKVIRPLTVFGYDDAPHGHAEVLAENVTVAKEDAMLLGHGKGFEIAQARLGPGRIHHCMRTIGALERSLELTKARIKERHAFGKPLAGHGSIQADVARARIHIDQSRLLVEHCARKIDAVGNKNARKDIAMIKVAIPQMACAVLDSLLQMWGGMGLSADTPLAHFYAQARILRLADGPDEVHLGTIAKLELKE
mmetsp:Transcript_10348/g.34176  ORF Transcript_10348/g.34176 Transcript_10348/m.34176 type:complete len:840 (+) Transcript_10348:43-2562(+)